MKGNTYIFEQSVGTNGHVLGISAVSGGISVGGLTYSYTPAGGASTIISTSTYATYLTNPAYVSFFSSYNFAITYTVPDDAPDSLFFFSSSSSVSGGTFNITSGYVPPPEPPTPVDPDVISINENELGAVIGSLTTTDQDIGDTHVYTISGVDAALFEIVNGTLKLKDTIAANYEDNSTLNITITATDSSGLALSQNFAVTVNNLNDAPSQIYLSSTSVNEAEFGGVIGSLTTADDDADDTHSYTLSGDDAEFFEVVDGKLKFLNSIAADYETKNSYAIVITSTDSEGLTHSQSFQLSVNNINEPVTSISLGSSNFSTVEEGIPGQIIESFIIDDPDLGEKHSYLLTGQDAKYFDVVDGVLQLKSDIALDYEALNFNSYDDSGNPIKLLTATVTVIDSGGYAVKNNFFIQVLNTNDVPSGLTLDGTGINKNSNLIGKLNVSDQDDQAFTFSVDNQNFEIVDGYLQLKNDADLQGELWDTLIISITATDSANNSITRSFELTHISVGAEFNVEENVENAIVGSINHDIKNSDYQDGWVYTLAGPDSQNFRINEDNKIELIGSANFESKSSYELVIIYTHDSGLTYSSLQTINIIDRNDSPDLWYSHANNLAFYSSDINAGATYMFGITENTDNPYIMTLAFGDEDLNDSFSIQITYQQYSGYTTDNSGNYVNLYEGSVVDITNLFSFDTETGALHFSDHILDFESRSGDETGITPGHLWHEPITITVTDAAGAQSSMTILMNTWDDASDNQFNLSFDGSYTNFNNEASNPFWIGGFGDSDTGDWPSFADLVHGDINGDNIPDLVAWMENSDYGYDVDGYQSLPGDYSYMRISLGGPNSYPNFEMGTGESNHNDVFGSGNGSVYVILPLEFTNPLESSPWNDVRYYYFKGMSTTDFNGDGMDDVVLHLRSSFTNKDYLIIGYGQNFDNSSFNVMDLSNLFSDETNGRVIDLSNYSESNLYIQDVGDLNSDGKGDIIVNDYNENIYIIQGASSQTQTPTSIHLNGNLIQPEMWFGDGVAVGDFNGDGRDDLAVSADLYDENSLFDTDEGAIFIYLSGFNGIGSSPDITIIGDTQATRLGWGGVVNLGDINGDGNEDLGFSDSDGYSWVYWGSSNFSGTLDLATTTLSTTQVSVFDLYNIEFDEVTAIGDINGDGYDDLAINSLGADEFLVLYGMQNWLSLYESTQGLNILSLSYRFESDTYSYSEIFALGDWDGDGLDEFAFTGRYNYNSQNRYDNFLTVWQGDNSAINADGFTLNIENNVFSVNENHQGAEVGSLNIIGQQSNVEYEYFIRWVQDAEGTTLENIWFDISNNGEISLKPGVSLDAEEYSSFSLRVFVVDNTNHQISQHYIEVLVNDQNEAPSISLSSRFIDESVASAGSVIGVIDINDPDGDTVTISITGEDASYFTFNAETNELSFADDALIDPNDQRSFSIVIFATDHLGGHESCACVVEINQAPIDLTYDAGVVQESARGIALGKVEVTDVNPSDSFTYSIAGDYSFMFEISDEGVIYLARNHYLDYEELGQSMTLSVTVTDISGASLTKDITIDVVDIKYATPSVSEITQHYSVKPTDTIIDGLLLGFTLDSDWNPNTPLTVTYSFVAADTQHLSARVVGYVGDGGIDPTSYGFRDATIEALNHIGELLGINFVEVTETDTQVGDIRFVLFEGDVGFSGVAFPYDYGYDQILNSSINHDILIPANNNTDSNGNPDFSKGSYGYHTILHEIGHVIGLSHGQDWENVQYWNYGPDGDNLEETLYFPSLDELGYSSYGWNGWTVMDYREYAGHDYNISIDNPSATIITVTDTGENLYPTTFMPLDISASLYLYGWWDDQGVYILNDVNAGDDTYVLEGPFFETIHDTGGTDTLDWSQTSDNTVVNLNPFSLSYFGENKITIESYTGQVDQLGWILGISEFTYIENIKAGSGNDLIILNNVSNLIQSGDGNDTIYDIDSGDNVYGNAGNDDLHALSNLFSIIDGGEGNDTLFMEQTLLDSGIFSVDFRSVSDTKINSIEILDYSGSHVSGPGHILISVDTFKALDQTNLTIFSTWSYDLRQAVGLEGDFKLSGSTDSWDRYTLSQEGETFTLWVWKDHYVYQIQDSELQLSLSNEVLVDDASWFVGNISLDGETWLNSNKSWNIGNMPDAVFSISGEDAASFFINNNNLYIESKPDFETKSSYSITITATSLSGISVSKDFVLQVQDTEDLTQLTSSNQYIGDSGDNFIVGSSNINDLRGNAGSDVIYGTSGDDDLTGDTARGYLDPANSDDGNDSLFGGSGNDRLWGNGGNDKLYGEGGNDILYGQQGDDHLYGGYGDDDIRGGVGNDILFGNDGDDLMYGDEAAAEGSLEGNGDDIMYGGDGSDTMRGGDGNDILYGGADADSLEGGSGNDDIHGNDGNDTILGEYGNDNIYGGEGDDLIYGDGDAGDFLLDGNDVIWGGSGNDQLYGRGGNDYLIGQSGDDTLIGGEGADIFVLTSYSSDDSKDTIKDYVDGTDKIGLINIDFDSLTITQDVNAVDTNISDSDGNIIAVLEGVTASDIDAGDFVSLDYDLSEILEITPSMVNLELVSLGVGDEMSEDINGEQSHSEVGSADNSTINSPGSASSNNSFNSNALINGDLIDSLIDHTEDLGIGFNDFI